MKSGLYQQVLKKEDQKKFQKALDDLGTLDREITLSRFRLQEVIANKVKWDEEHSQDMMEMEEIREIEGEKVSVTTTLRRPDFEGAADRLTNLIGRLEEKRATVLKVGEMEERLKEALEGRDNGDIENEAGGPEEDAEGEETAN